MEIHIKETIRRENLKGMESTIGLRAASSRETSKQVSDVVRDLGKKVQERQIAMKDLGSTTRNMDMEFLPGQMAMSIEGISVTTSRKEKASFSRLTVL